VRRADPCEQPPVKSVRGVYRQFNRSRPNVTACVHPFKRSLPSHNYPKSNGLFLFFHRSQPADRMFDPRV
jgi:hypothetical protein